MNFLNLKNNALFLSCWYERFRPVQIICFGILILSIMLLSFLNVSMNGTKSQEEWKSLFYIIAGAQALILLIQGSMFASQMGSRERTSETLDFHRNSPEPVEAKVAGLILGSTWFEWSVFFIFFILELPFVLITDIRLVDILLFNASLILSGVFFHTTGAALSLLSAQKKRGSPFALLMLFLVFGGPAFFFYLSTSSSPFFSHLMGVTALKYLAADADLVSRFNGRFYTLEFPLLAMQALVQIPLFLLMANGMKRIFRLPNSPAWSKVDVVRFCGFLFFMIAGFFIADYMHFDEILAGSNRYFYPHNWNGFFKQEAFLFSAVFAAVGLVVSFFSAPSYFKCSKYALLSRKGLIRKSIFDDGATCFFTMVIYVAIGGVFAVPYLITIKPPVPNIAAYFCMLSSYVIAFAGLLEFFKLGKFRHNKIFIFTVLLLWWVFIPWIMVLTLHLHLDQQVSVAALSPFVGLAYAVPLLWERDPVDFIAVFTPCLVAVSMWVLAWREYSLVKKHN